MHIVRLQPWQKKTPGWQCATPLHGATVRRASVLQRHPRTRRAPRRDEWQTGDRALDGGKAVIRVWSKLGVQVTAINLEGGAMPARLL